MGYPPALMPILGGLSMPRYYGVWHHWFLDRAPSFVRMSVWADRSVSEVARTEEQFVAVLIAKSVAEFGGIDAEILQFAAELGVPDLTEIDRVTDLSGDNPEGFVALRAFSKSVPLDSVKDEASYDGSFPEPSSRERLAKACSFEVDEDVSWDVSLFPPWLKQNRDLHELFRNFLHRGDFGPAWLTLNTTGWTMRDARAAVMRLADAAQDEAFSRLAELWCNNNGDELGGY
jgi:hypothetical protein